MAPENSSKVNAFSARTRWAIYCIFFALSCAMMIWQIWIVTNPTGKTPLLSANDKSRWLTIRALGDLNTYEIDEVMKRRTDWYSIDMVRHKGSDGRQHYYSSKPPLLPTLMTYEYLALKKINGVEVSKNPFLVAKVLLITFNVIPILVICILIALMAENYLETNWPRILVVAFACFGTYLTTFSVTLNNHVPAAMGAAIGIFALARIWVDESRSWAIYFVAGVGAGWAAANELPALSFVGVAIVATLIKSVPKSITGTLLGIAVIAFCFFSTNFIAHGEFVPAYAHRKDGPVIMTIDNEIASALEKAIANWNPHMATEIPRELRKAVSSVGNGEDNSDGNSDDNDAEFSFSPHTEMIPSGSKLKEGVVDRWVIFDEEAETMYAITKPESGLLELRSWGNWYEYPGSYWTEGNRKGIDLGEKSISKYALHVFVGHHGIFSLTPIWLLALGGMLVTLCDRKNPMFWIVIALVILSAVVISFYIFRPEIDRNYGGVSCVLRWLLWFCPLWLVCILAAGEKLFSSIFMRVIAIVLLLISAASAFSAFPNPWQHPWLTSWLG